MDVIEYAERSGARGAELVAGNVTYRETLEGVRAASLGRSPAG